MDIAKYLVEVRYKPVASVLDVRGSITDSLTSELLNQWTVLPNSINLRSEEDADIEAFFSYKNFGLVVRSPHDERYFHQGATKFIKDAWDHVPTRNMVRVGVRSSFLCPVDDFSSLFEAYRDFFLKPSDEELKPFGGELIDLGFPLNFSDGDNKFNVITGPMDKKQAKNYFGEDIELPENAAYVDVDFFQNGLVNARPKDLTSFLTAGIEKGQTIKKLISEKIIS